jgi:hypothetical protein
LSISFSGSGAPQAVASIKKLITIATDLRLERLRGALIVIAASEKSSAGFETAPGFDSFLFSKFYTTSFGVSETADIGCFSRLEDERQQRNKPTSKIVSVGL